MRKIYNIVLVIFLITGIIFPLELVAQKEQSSSMVTQKEFKKFKDSMNLEIKKMNHTVIMSEQTLAAAKEYTTNTNTRVGKYFTSVDIGIGIMAFLFTIMAITGFASNFFSGKKFKERMKEIEEDAEVKINNAKLGITKTIETEVNKLINNNAEIGAIQRLLVTEELTIEAKEKAHVLFVLDRNSVSIEMTQFKNVIFKDYTYDDQTFAFNIEDLINGDNEKFNEFLKNAKAFPKIIIMNDDLFNKLGTSRNGKSPYTQLDNEEGKDTVHKLFQLLKSNGLGFALYGQLGLKDFDLPYKAYSNEPYTLYGNVNNLLKYMLAVSK